METENKNPKEIQQEIFDQISKGANPVELKELLRKKGVPVEGYYFVSEAAHKRQIETPPQYGVSQQAGGGASAWQIFVAILSVVLLIFRIARCSSRHNY
jgi:hypothetical protein